jgi:hypothetical protein
MLHPYSRVDFKDRKSINVGDSEEHRRRIASCSSAVLHSHISSRFFTNSILYSLAAAWRPRGSTVPQFGVDLCVHKIMGFDVVRIFVELHGYKLH